MGKGPVAGAALLPQVKCVLTQERSQLVPTTKGEKINAMARPPIGVLRLE